MAEQKIYSDGEDIENLMLRIAQEDLDYKDPEFYKDNNIWPLSYHFSDQRHDLLHWYDFKSDGNLLEIGAGCGALTALFAKRLNSVVAVEPSSKRAEILNTRHKGLTNINTIVSNSQDFTTDQKFDYVTSIGVLEYSGTYVNSENPYHKFLSTLKSFLKPNGKLILAIENKFGIKYWAGAPEDHTGIYFDGLENYQDNNKVKTFSKIELTKLLEEVGFTHLEFYYPFPDYKFCYEIFSDKHLPTEEKDINSWNFPSSHPSGREFLFNEFLVLRELRRNGLFDKFANSFLVFAQ